MSNSINTLLRNKANNKIYYPITKGENIIQDKDHRLVTDEQTTSWDKLKETKYDKTGGLISGDVSISTGKLYLANKDINTIYGAKSDNTNLILLQSDSTNNTINLGDTSSKLYLSASTTPFYKDPKMNKDFVFLTEDNIRNTKIQRVMLSYGGDIVVGDNPTSVYNLITGDNQKNITIGDNKSKINIASDIYFNANTGIKSSSNNDILIEKDKYIYLGNNSKPLHLLNDVVMEKSKLYMADGDNTYMALSLINSTVELGNSSINTSILGSGDLKYNGYKILNTNNYNSTLDDVYLSKTAKIPANRVYSGAANPFNGALYITKDAGIRSSNLNDILLEEKDKYIQLGNTQKEINVSSALKIDSNSYIALDEDAYISSSSNDGAGTLLQYSSGVLHVGASGKELQLDCTAARVNSGTILTQYNYGGYIGDTYIKSSGNANGKPMSGSFYVDNGYKLIAPSYDNANNRVENTNNTLIDVHYNYNSSNTASRYPNFWTIGDRNLDLNINAKSITLSGTINGDGIGPVIRTLYHGSGNPGEIIIGNYDSATAPSLTLTGSSITARCLSVTGSKNCVQHTESYGDILFYSTEDAESLLTWTNKLKSCNTGKSKEIKIEIDPMFKESVDLENDYIVDIYKISFGDYRIKEKSKDYFVLESSVDNFEFQFSIKAHRKGYETAYMDKFNKSSSIE